MDYPQARIVWTSHLDFEIEPELPAADLVRFMIYSPEYHEAQRVWLERREAVATHNDAGRTVVLRPGATVADDVTAGSPVDPTTAKGFQ